MPESASPNTSQPTPSNKAIIYPPVILPLLIKGWSAADRKEYAAIVINEYWTWYYWEDPINEEPTSLLVPPHLDIIHPSKGPLKAAKLTQINVGIYNWLDYQWKCPQKTAQDGPTVWVQNAKGKSSEDPFHLLLCNVLGVDDNGDQFKSKLQHEVGGNSHQKIRTSSSVIRTKFAALSEVEQKKYEKLVKDKRKKVCKARAQAILKAGNLLDPTQVQRDVEVIIHPGYDKQARPLQFPEANPKMYNKITSLFQNWAETCYTKEEKLSQSLTLPPNLEDAMVESNDDDMTESNNEEGPMSKTSTSKSKAKGKVNGKGKHHGKEMHQPNVTVLHSIRNHVQVPSEPLSYSAWLSNMVQLPAIDPVLLEVSNLPPICTEPITNVLPYQTIYGGTPITGPHDNPNSFPVALNHPDAGLFPCNTPSAPAVPLILSMVPLLPVLLAMLSLLICLAVPLLPALLTMPVLRTSPLADPLRLPVIDESDTVNPSGVMVFLDQTLWPPWLVLICDTLEGLELPGPQWKMVLINWWAYWKSLQLDWCGIKEVKGPLSHMHCQDDITEDWGELEKQGIDGVVSLVTGLGFWGILCKGRMCHQKDQWDDTIEETNCSTKHTVDVVKPYSNDSKIPKLHICKAKRDIRGCDDVMMWRYQCWNLRNGIESHQCGDKQKL
ncbi:hypothetical protein ARMGADRAFT_1033764 [Armillaria gallica]|uniref:Uncharacterized protein n=1 Tax=Armillaria gallica TaxID=47427 RepID=A0A2H3DD28_ARMGA|nr:hypothetical protein ARMGADRAFT_1033764 [Armillaria gallica]